MFAGGKDKYTCVLSLIKRESPELYEVINELCIDGIFRSQRYQNTFLMPDTKLVKKLSKMVADDKDDEAIDAIRSLVLKKHYTLNDFKTKDIVIGTLQSNSKVLKSPSDVASKLSVSKKTIYGSKGEPTFLIYNYSGEDVPETVEGKSGGMVLASSGVYGGNKSKEIDHIRDITKSFIVEDNADKTIKNFFKAVAGVLVELQNEENTDSFEKAKFYLSSNPILSWFFLTMPGYDHALVKDEHLKDFDFSNVIDTEIIKECINTNYSFDKDLFKHINKCRTQLIGEKGDKSSLMEGIKGCYKKMMNKIYESKSVDSGLVEALDHKILMDELRFMYDSCVDCWEDVEDTLATLGSIDWNNPSKHHVLTNDDMYKKHMLKGTESFICGPVSFVKSVYFLYVPLTESIEEQLEMSHKKGGSISGGNPNSVNNIIFKGGAASKMYKVSGTKLTSFVKTLSKSQKAALKGML